MPDITSVSLRASGPTALRIARSGILRQAPRTWTVAALLVVTFATPARAERLKLLADLEGARANQLVGYGLVVGLAGTGDDAASILNRQAVANMLRRLGVQNDPEKLRLRNVAAIMVTAELPAFTKAGQRLDVTVSSVGNAKSLEGGTLLVTPLKGSDLQTYAVAQGPLTVGGYSATGRTGSRISKNHTTVGRIPGGAVVERAVEVAMAMDTLNINLRAPDFTNATRMADAINAKLTPPPAAPEPVAADAVVAEVVALPPIAAALDAGTVQVQIPQQYKDRLPVLVALLEVLEIVPDLPTQVVVNERTGTVVLGSQVRLYPVAIAHGGLTLEIRESFSVSQPGAFSSGETKVVPESSVVAREQTGQLLALEPDASLGAVVKALNALGVTPRDLVSILQALKTSGALRAEVIVQ